MALLLVEVKEPELLVLVLVSDPFAVRGRHAIEAEDFPVLGQSLRFSDPVCGNFFKLKFSRFVRQREQGLAVPEETRFAISDSLLARAVHKTTLADRSDEHLAPGGQHQPIGVR